MFRTIEALIDENGKVHLLEHVSIAKRQRALVTILDEEIVEERAQVSATALLSEQALASDWDRPEEDEAWSHLQPER